MTTTAESNELFQTSHLTLLISYTLFSTALIIESFLMGWEKWMLLLVVAGVIVSWILHIRHNTPANVRIWIYAVLMMGEFFFYGTHQTSTFDLAVVISAAVLNLAVQGEMSAGKQRLILSGFNSLKNHFLILHRNHRHE